MYKNGVYKYNSKDDYEVKSLKKNHSDVDFVKYNINKSSIINNNKKALSNNLIRNN